MFDKDTTTRFVYHSNRLDGLGLTEAQTREVLDGKVAAGGSLESTDGKSLEAEVVLGHRRAFDAMVALARGKDPIATTAVLALHKALMGELLLSAGEWRECTLRYKGLLITSPAEGLAERMQRFCDLLNSGLAKSTDAHKLSWRIHHEFITIHPFIEANGRMARLLLNLVRLRRGLDLTIVPFENRDKYSKAIIEFQQQKIRRDQEKKAQAADQER
jgi:Fic family protein